MKARSFIALSGLFVLCTASAVAFATVYRWYPDKDGDGDGRPGRSYASEGRCEALTGFSCVRSGRDCNDRDASISIYTRETWYDGIDQNCDGSSDFDADRDGYDSDAYGGTDCLDDEFMVNPGTAPDAFCLEVSFGRVVTDINCDGVDELVDADADHHLVAVGEASSVCDCDDSDASIYAFAPGDIAGDGIDQNCDGFDGDDACSDSGTGYDTAECDHGE